MGGLVARSLGDVVWLAVPPDDMTERARDVLDGLALLDDVTIGMGGRGNEQQGGSEQTHGPGIFARAVGASQFNDA